MAFVSRLNSLGKVSSVKSPQISQRALTRFCHQYYPFSLRKISRRLVALVFVVLSLIFSLESARAQDRPQLSAIDRTRLAEAFRLGARIGDQIWPDWSKAPFAVLLVTAEHEFLIRHPKPSADFNSLGYDPSLKSDVYYRKRHFLTHFLATFPAISGSMISTIVVGQAENTTARTSTRWVITLLHEHFHQLQDSQPSYYTDANALNLSRGDQTGMWMLNYAFPYERTDVQQQFSAMSQLLAAAVQPRSLPRAERAKRARAYLEARRKFQQLLPSDDYKYFSFQFWKEGIARYTEYQVARLAAKYRPTKEFRALKDCRSFAEVGKSMYEEIFRELLTQKLGESKREVVYAFGAAEGLLLDEINPRWRSRYFEEKFDLWKLFP
ncbi:MAG: hypothetical protein ND866_29500 [Pyrinomonadaceae bacterium]|nr:hypothetical protein [Pyrinomonadaceae bacterium]